MCADFTVLNKVTSTEFYLRICLQDSIGRLTWILYSSLKAGTDLSSNFLSCWETRKQGTERALLDIFKQNSIAHSRRRG